MKERLKKLRDRFLSSVLVIVGQMNETIQALKSDRDSDMREIAQAFQTLKSERDNDMREIVQTFQALKSELDNNMHETAQELGGVRQSLCDIKSLAVNGLYGARRLYLDASTANEILNKMIADGKRLDYEKVLEIQYSKIVNEGDFFIDIGCHAGRHLSALMKLVKNGGGGGIAFEPLERQYKALCETFNDPCVKIFNLALSDASGMMDFYENETYPEESGLKKRIYNNDDGVVTVKKVKVSTLDAVAETNITKLDYIKLDAEGAEIQILKGAVNTINRYRPVISVEYGYPSYSAYDLQKSSLYDFAGSVNYFVTDIFGNLIPTSDMWQKFCDGVYWDYFLVPEEKLEFFHTKVHSSTDDIQFME